MARSLTREQRARRYLQASMSAGYTGLAAEHREAYEAQMRAHERAYPGVREHALAGSDQDFDKPLAAGEREHQRSLRDKEGLQHADVLRIRRDLRGQGSGGRRRAAARRPPNPRLAGPRAARAAAGGAGGAIAAATGGRGSTPLYLLGIGLLLTLVYLLVAGRGASALQGAVGVITGGVRAFVAPVDPVAAAERALGATAVSSSAPAATSPVEGVTGTTAAGSTLSGGVTGGANAGPTAGGTLPPPPGSIRATSTSGLPPASILRADLKLRAQNAQLVAQHKLTRAAAIKREEHLIPRAKYPAFYGK